MARWVLEKALSAGADTFLGITGTIKSPSYSWVEVTSVPLGTLNHLIFTDLEIVRDWEAYGFDSYFDQHAIALIEWPEKVATLLPPVDLTPSVRLPTFWPPSNGALIYSSR